MVAERRVSTTTIPLLVALMEHRVQAEVIDCDHYRIDGGMAVATDYIIQVRTHNDSSATEFRLSKTYRDVRSLGNQLKQVADQAMTVTRSTTGNQRDDDETSTVVRHLAQYCETVLQLVEAQRYEYLGKVNYPFVKVLAKKRRHIIQEVLDTTLSHFPESLDDTADSFPSQVAKAIETFFLMDHCMETGRSSPSSTSRDTSPSTSPKQQLPTLILEKPLEAIEMGSKAIGESVGNAVDMMGKNMDMVGKNMGDLLKIHLNGEEPTPRKKGPPPPIDTTSDVATLLSTPVEPYTRKIRRSVSCRGRDDQELEEIGKEASLTLDQDCEFASHNDEQSPATERKASKVGHFLQNHPFAFASLGFFLMSCSLRHFAERYTITLDLDIMLVIVWSAFGIGLYTPRPTLVLEGLTKNEGGAPARTLVRSSSSRTDRHGHRLLRMSMIASPSEATSHNSMTFDDIRQEDQGDVIMATVNMSPLPRFPKDAVLGSKNNCWSTPDCAAFHVRGENYLHDKIKVASKEFLFPLRACDLFLTDACPVNVGSNGGVMGGRLREKNSFVVNFRLPWGVFIAYFEIPDRFMPFVQAGHEADFDQAALPPMDKLSGAERCAARWLMGSEKHKNDTLKILPKVVAGPWVVKSVVGRKPAIIGTKLPVNYIYQAAEGDKAAYLEADLDIVASSAARGILSVARTYTQVLTLDLGFVIQGNTNDELPEQMLVGARLHGIDPITAPPYPLDKHMFEQHETSSEDGSDQ